MLNPDFHSGDAGMTYFAKTNFRGEGRVFGIHDADRLQHIYVLGRSGTGKTTLLENFIAQDMSRGHGLALLDPHGDLAERVLDYVPKPRVQDVIYANASDLAFPMPFNILEALAPTQQHLVASGLISIFARFWGEFWGPRTEYIARNAILLLTERTDTTLLDMSRVLVDEHFRRDLLSDATNPAVRQFWHGEFDAYPDRFRQEAIAPLQNKVGQFLQMPLIQNIIGQRQNRWQLRTAMDEGRIVIVNLSKGLLGEDASSLLGSLILTRLLLAALSRQDLPEHRRRPFFVYVDELHSFATPATYATLLAEARKFGISLVLANQYLEQLGRPLQSAVFGNAGTVISFRSSVEDAGILAREFGGAIDPEDVVALDSHNIYLRLSVAGVTSAAFSGETLPRPWAADSHRGVIVAHSRERFARPREWAEKRICRDFPAGDGPAFDKIKRGTLPRSDNGRPPTIQP